MPIGDVLVGDSRSHIKENDGTLSPDVISVTKPSELFLASGIPHIKPGIKRLNTGFGQGFIQVFRKGVASDPVESGRGGVQPGWHPHPKFTFVED